VREMRLESIAVLEFRDPSWWRLVGEIESCGAVFCSVDAPDLPREVVVSNDTIYLRMHGRTAWYAHYYTRSELIEAARLLLSSGAERIYVCT